MGIFFYVIHDERQCMDGGERKLNYYNVLYY